MLGLLARAAWQHAVEINGRPKDRTRLIAPLRRFKKPSLQKALGKTFASWSRNGAQRAQNDTARSTAVRCDSARRDAVQRTAAQRDAREAPTTPIHKKSSSTWELLFFMQFNLHRRPHLHGPWQLAREASRCRSPLRQPRRSRSRCCWELPPECSRPDGQPHRQRWDRFHSS